MVKGQSRELKCVAGRHAEAGGTKPRQTQAGRQAEEVREGEWYSKISSKMRKENRSRHVRGRQGKNRYIV